MTNLRDFLWLVLCFVVAWLGGEWPYSVEVKQ